MGTCSIPNNQNRNVLVEVTAFVSQGQVVSQPAIIPDADSCIQEIEWPTCGLVNFSYKGVIPVDTVTGLQPGAWVILLLKEAGLVAPEILMESIADSPQVLFLEGEKGKGKEKAADPAHIHTFWEPPSDNTDDEGSPLTNSYTLATVL